MGAIRPQRKIAAIPMLEVLLLALFLVLPAFLPDYLTVFATRLLILALLALSFDLVWGYAGILSFGQALFFGSAGYVAALLARDVGITSIFLVLPLTLMVGLLLSFLMACFLLLGRIPPSAMLVALGTLTGSYAADRLARGWYYLGGQNGIPSLPEMTIGSFAFEQGPVYYDLSLGLLVVVYLFCRFLVRSQFGLVLAGIREQEARVAFFGYRVQQIKTIVFSIAGAIAGLAGGLYTFHEGFVWPNMVGVILSTQIVLYALFGGVGTLIGPVVGVIAIESASYALSDNFQRIWPIVLGCLLLVVILLRPNGLISLIVSPEERVGSFGRARSLKKRES
jgi:branched-chain amino acid transport system permease protein